MSGGEEECELMPGEIVTIADSSAAAAAALASRSASPLAKLVVASSDSSSSSGTTTHKRSSSSSSSSSSSRSRKNGSTKSSKSSASVAIEIVLDEQHHHKRSSSSSSSKKASKHKSSSLSSSPASRSGPPSASSRRRHQLVTSSNSEPSPLAMAPPDDATAPQQQQHSPTAHCTGPDECSPPVESPVSCERSFHRKRRSSDKSSSSSSSRSSSRSANDSTPTPRRSKKASSSSSSCSALSPSTDKRSSSSSASSSAKRSKKKHKRSRTDDSNDGFHDGSGGGFEYADDGDDIDYLGGEFEESMSEGEDFVCLTEADIIAEQSREIENVSEILSIPQSAAIALLKHYKWKREKLLLAYFENPTRVLASAGVSLPPPPHTSTSMPALHHGAGTSLSSSSSSAAVTPSPTAGSSSSSAPAAAAAATTIPDECSICCDEITAASSFALDSCAHYFCLSCWQQHLATQINNGNSAGLKCPHLHCHSLVLDTAVQRLVDDATYRKYRTFIMQSFVDDNENVKWCPAPGCGNAITAAMVDGLTVTCKCGYRFCFRCNEQAHLPASCEQMKLWFVKCRDESETKHWIAANTKECPKCVLPTEKNGGCNHMTCRNCKYEYCWVCLKDWKGHNDYYTCNRFQGKDKDKKEKEKAAAAAAAKEKRSRSKRKHDELRRLEMKAALDKYLHYYSRYQNHSHSSELEQFRDKAMLRMQEIQATEATAAEVRFIKDATDQLLECRHVLKYSYVIGYYLEDEASKNLFEYLQEDLEKTVEQLSEALEVQEKTKLTDIMKDKVKIITMTKVAKTRLGNFLLAVCNPRFQSVPPNATNDQMAM